jgi:hypothetical protein
MAGTKISPLLKTEPDIFFSARKEKKFFITVPGDLL